TKYLLIVNAFLLLVLAIFFVVDIHRTEEIMTGQAVESLREMGNALRASIHSQREFDAGQIQEAIRSFQALHKDIGIMVLDGDSRILASTAPGDRGRIWEEKEIWEILRGSADFTHHTMRHKQVKVLDITLPLIKESRIVGALHISKTLQSVNVGLWEMKKGHLLNIVINLLLLSFLINFITYRLIIRRLHRLAYQMEKVGEGKTTPMPVSEKPAGDEIGRLEREFSAMVEKIASSTARLQETLAERELLLLQVKDFNQELERKIQEVTASLEATHSELMRKERLATVGQLTAGIAHEIRNPLLIIKGSAEMLQKKVTDHGDLIADIREEADRVNRIVSELLEYARPLSLERQTVHLGFLLDQVWARLERLTAAESNKEIRFQQQIPPTLLLDADPALMEQALLNLLLNAWQAIPEKGEIGVQGKQTDDGSLQLQITDDGCGISPEDLPRVFSPFFTKRKGGIGLGLSMAQKTIEAHGGEISIQSRMGKGTTVTVRLPQPRSSLGDHEGVP
ncbi:MAG: ATP-binding protein, partial [candidate division NC10 bacterium]|nr:ATP-binding protein [candidate division NC10 bacterium]